MWPGEPAAALRNTITIGAGRVEQQDLHDYSAVRVNEAPPTQTPIVPSREKPGGAGEHDTRFIAPADGGRASLGGRMEYLAKLPGQRVRAAICISPHPSSGGPMDFSALGSSLQTTLGAQLPGILGALGILIIGWLAAVIVRGATALPCALIASRGSSRSGRANSIRSCGGSAPPPQAGLRANRVMVAGAGTLMEIFRILFGMDRGVRGADHGRASGRATDARRTVRIPQDPTSALKTFETSDSPAVRRRTGAIDRATA